jgi:DNA-binding transcriptional LysR family regulator
VSRVAVVAAVYTWVFALCQFLSGTAGSMPSTMNMMPCCARTADDARSSPSKGAKLTAKTALGVVPIGQTVVQEGSLDGRSIATGGRAPWPAMTGTQASVAIMLDSQVGKNPELLWKTTMHSKAIRYFLEVARAGSFRAASEVLHVAASAINRQMTLLEKDVGAELFERGRGRKRLRLTPAGEVFLTHSRAATEQIEKGLQEIDALKRIPTGIVTLGVAETFVHEFLPQFLARFRENYPHIWFKVIVGNSSRLIEMLIHDDVGIALLYNEKIPSSVRAIVELERRTCIMVRRDHPLAQRKYIGIRECADFTVVMPELGTSMRRLYDEIFSHLKLKPQFSLVTTSYEMLRSGVRAGLGIAIVNEYLTPTRPDLMSDLVFIPIRHSIARPQRLLCCVPRDRKLAAATSAFALELERELRPLKETSRSGGRALQRKMQRETP